MDVPSEYDTLMKQAYGLTSPELNQTVKHRKEKEPKSKKNTEKKAAKDAANRRSSAVGHLTKRDRAMSCIDITAAGSSAGQTEGLFRRGASQRLSFLGKTSLTRRIKEVHKSLTSLVAEHEEQSPPAEDERKHPLGDTDMKPEPSAAPGASASGSPASSVSCDGDDAARPITASAQLPWSLAGESLSVVREAYQRQQTKESVRVGSGMVRRRANSMRVRAIRRNHSQRSWDPRLADLLETSGLENDEAASGNAEEASPLIDAKNDGRTGTKTGEGIAAGEEGEAVEEVGRKVDAVADPSRPAAGDDKAS